MVPPSRQALVDRLNRYDRLLEIAIGDRRGVARALADRGCDVVALDVAVDEPSEYVPPEADGSLLIRRGDVVALASIEDPLASLEDPLASLEDPQPTEAADPMSIDPAASAPAGVRGFDAVYALNLPGELQRPAVSLADALDADCLFTTLGFEEPVVPVERRSVRGTTVHVARWPRRGE